MYKLNTLSLIILLLLPGGKNKFWQEGNISTSYDASKIYKVAILPISVIDPTLEDRQDLKTLAYNQAILSFSAIGNLSLISKETVEQACNTLAFGATKISSSQYQELANYLNVDLLATCVLSKEKMNLLKNKEVGTIMATLQLIEPNKNNAIMYIGRGRSINPLSESNETETAVQQAVAGLKK